MRKFDPFIPLREELAMQIFNSLQGDVVSPIRMNAQSLGVDIDIRSSLDGRSVKVSEGLLGDFYRLCMEVKESLGFEEEVDFYITGSPELNARSYASEVPGKNHAIEIYSGLYDLLNEDEKRFIIGHEMGHLINHDRLINGLYYYIYPLDENGQEGDECPVFLRKRHELFAHLCELESDRYGFEACQNLEACVTASFKMSSGLKFTDDEVTLDALIEENDRRLNYFLEDEGNSEDGDHPVDPIRVKALQLYATAKTQKALNEGMDVLLHQLQNFILDEESELLRDFVASAGLIMANLDGKKDKIEEEYILSIMGRFCIHPIKALKAIEKGDVNAVFEETTAKLMENNPGKNDELLHFLVDVAMADGKLAQCEVEYIYEFGQKVGLEGSYITCVLSDAVQNNLQADASVLK